jgi:hypothetical protein
MFFKVEVREKRGNKTSLKLYRIRGGNMRLTFVKGA